MKQENKNKLTKVATTTVNEIEGPVTDVVVPVKKNKRKYHKRKKAVQPEIIVEAPALIVVKQTEKPKFSLKQWFKDIFKGK